jgi:hypothetical protein
MIIRVFVYLQLLALAAIGLASYWDRVGIPAGPSHAIYGLGICCVYLIPIFPIVLLGTLWFSKVSQRQKLYAVIIGVSAFVAQVIATIPLIQ